MKTKITKIVVVADPKHETAQPVDYVCGVENSLSPFVGYWVVGTLLTPIKLGKSIRMNREIRNGVKVDGYFVSSIVQKIDDTRIKFDVLIVETDNSIYKIEEIEEN